MVEPLRPGRRASEVPDASGAVPAQRRGQPSGMSSYISSATLRCGSVSLELERDGTPAEDDAHLSSKGTTPGGRAGDAAACQRLPSAASSAREAYHSPLSWWDRASTGSSSCPRTMVRTKQSMCSAGSPYATDNSSNSSV